MYYQYLPVMIMLGLAVFVALLLYTLTTVLGPKNQNDVKDDPFESGMPSEGARHLRLSVKFYLTAILFVVFDIEAVFLYPWAARFRNFGWFGLAEMFAFLVVLTVTLVYAWRKGALEWEN